MKLLKKIGKKNICLIGLMGSGKSIIGKDLSKYLNFKFYDTDKEIELSTKKSINEILDYSFQFLTKLSDYLKVKNMLFFYFFLPSYNI